MLYRELAISGAWEISPTRFVDSRGEFIETFKATEFASEMGRPFDIRQVNTSVSSAGAVRGIHFAQLPPGQAKYVTCPRGAVMDYVIDIRVGSPTFGGWDSALLDDVDRRVVFISEGLGHVFVSLEDNSTVVYLCSAQYAPGREFGVNPFCEEIGIRFPQIARDGSPLDLLVSDKDAAAPGLQEAIERGLLPTFDEQQQFVQTMRARA